MSEGGREGGRERKGGRVGEGKKELEKNLTGQPRFTDK